MLASTSSASKPTMQAATAVAGFNVAGQIFTLKLL
jgi:hypothetical protein